MEEIEIDLAIANRILALTLSTNLLNSVEEPNKESVTIKQFYNQVARSLQKKLFLGFNKKTYFLADSDILETDNSNVVWYRLPSDWLITRRLITSYTDVAGEGDLDYDFAERTNPDSIGFPSGCLPMGVVYSFYNKNSEKWPIDFVEAFEHAMATRLLAPLARVYDPSHQTYLNNKTNELISDLRLNSAKNEGNPRKTIRSAYPNEGRGYAYRGVRELPGFPELAPGAVPPTRAGEDSA